eukprot:204669-Prymnesium_polylepis.1
MARIGVRALITKCSASSARQYPVDKGEALYPSALTWLAQKDPGHDPIELMLRAADSRNVTVHLGHWGRIWRGSTGRPTAHHRLGGVVT